MRLASLLWILAMAVVAALAPARVGAAEPAEPSAKVAVIVGPVGEELTPVYLALGEEAAQRAEASGAVVARAFSPEATPDNVLAAVEGANIVVYLGHGVGFPNPYSETPDPAVVNGWGLQGPEARGTHEDSFADGTLTYYGEAWIAENARPAPGWVMIYSNACYAPGAGEGQHPEATPEEALGRVGAYSHVPLAELSASAYFAVDFHAGAAELIELLLTRPDAAMGDIYASEPRFVADAVTREAHPTVEGAEVWMQRSAYFEDKVDYWYSFAGDPTATFAGASEGTLSVQIPVETMTRGGIASSASGPSATGPASVRVPPTIVPLRGLDGVVVGRASHYGHSAGWEGRATIALPDEIGGAPLAAGARPPSIVVCADRCAVLSVVDSCPCYVGTADQRVANLSDTAWRLVTDAPLADGLVDVVVYPVGTVVSPPSAPALTGSPAS